MNKLLVSLVSSCMLLAAGQTMAADDAMKKDNMDKPAMSQDDSGKSGMAKEGMKKKKHHRKKAKKSGMSSSSDMNQPKQ